MLLAVISSLLVDSFSFLFSAFFWDSESFIQFFSLFSSLFSTHWQKNIFSNTAYARREEKKRKKIHPKKIIHEMLFYSAQQPPSDTAQRTVLMFFFAHSLVLSLFCAPHPPHHPHSSRGKNQTQTTGGMISKNCVVCYRRAGSVGWVAVRRVFFRRRRMWRAPHTPAELFLSLSRSIKPSLKYNSPSFRITSDVDKSRTTTTSGSFNKGHAHTHSLQHPRIAVLRGDFFAATSRLILAPELYLIQQNITAKKRSRRAKHTTENSKPLL